MRYFNIAILISVFILQDQVAHAQQLRYDDLPDIGEFVVDGRRWDSPALTYYFQNGTSDIAVDGERQAIRDAFSLWQSASALTFTEVGSASQANIVIRWEFGDHGDGSPFDGVNGVLAHAFYPPPNGGSLAGDMHFDDAETWTLSTRTGGAQPIDLVTVAAHEIGHSIGLAHSQVQGALMYAYYSGSHRFLSTDDVQGVQSIYGPAVPPLAVSASGTSCIRNGYYGVYNSYRSGGVGPFQVTWQRYNNQCGAVEQSRPSGDGGTSSLGPPCGWTQIGVGNSINYYPSGMPYGTIQIRASLYDAGRATTAVSNVLYVSYVADNGPNSCNVFEVVDRTSAGVGSSGVESMGGRGTGADNNGGLNPSEYVLEGGQPNPFGTSSDLVFGLPEAGHVLLAVHDILGREVTRLIDGSTSAGWHRVRLDGSRLPAGVYVVRLEAGGRVLSSRLTRVD
jgi:hypothetical protein